MKKILFGIVLLLVSVALQYCKNESAEPGALQKVQFTFGPRSNGPSGGRTQAGEPTALLLSLENSIGETLFTSRRIALLHVGSSLMTEPIELPTGTYSITDFLLVDDDDVVLFATPKIGSPLAGAVTHPLPYSFTVSSDNASTIDMEVVDVSQSTPEDFGYASFNIHLVNTLKVAVFVYIDGELSITTADATLYQGDEVVDNYALQATTNILSFSGDPDASYRLLVAKEGYTNYVKDFVYSDLIAALHGEPLKIVLNQFTILAFVDDSGGFKCNIGGAGLEGLDVDWGDGTTEHTTGALEHTYATPGQHLITISGQLDLVTSINSAYGLGAMDAIDLRPLPHLKSLQILLTHGPEIMDARQNTELEFVSVEGVRELKQLLLPEENVITFLNIDGPNQISTANVDDIIEKIHSSVLLYHTETGFFQLDQSWTIPSNLMVGPPSPESVDKLRDLKNNYNWRILPDPGT